MATNEIRRRIADGRMLRTVEVWTKGADKWRPASNCVVFSGKEPNAHKRYNSMEKYMGSAQKVARSHIAFACEQAQEKGTGFVESGCQEGFGGGSC